MGKQKKMTYEPIVFDPETMTLMQHGAPVANVLGPDDFPCLDDDQWPAVQAQQEATGKRLAECYSAMYAVDDPSAYVSRVAAMEEQNTTLKSALTDAITMMRGARDLCPNKTIIDATIYDARAALVSCGTTYEEMLRLAKSALGGGGCNGQ